MSDKEDLQALHEHMRELRNLIQEEYHNRVKLEELVKRIEKRVKRIEGELKIKQEGR